MKIARVQMLNILNTWGWGSLQPNAFCPNEIILGGLEGHYVEMRLLYLVHGRARLV